MGSLIVYASRYGTTRTCVNELARLLDTEVDLCDVARDPAPQLEEYDTVIVGGPVYGGAVHPAVANFCKRARGRLLNRRLGLFICCIYVNGAAEKELERAFPEDLQKHATARAVFGGRVQAGKLGLFDRFLLARAAKLPNDIERIDHEAIRAFARRLNVDQPPGAIRSTDSENAGEGGSGDKPQRSHDSPSGQEEPVSGQLPPETEHRSAPSAPGSSDETPPAESHG